VAAVVTLTAEEVATAEIVAVTSTVSAAVEDMEVEVALMAVELEVTACPTSEQVFKNRTGVGGANQPGFNSHRADHLIRSKRNAKIREIFL
jgi:hypothetical protein